MRDDLTIFSDKYMANRRKIIELDQYLLEDLSFPQWKEVLIERSRTLRSIFEENESFITNIWDSLNDDANEETARTLYDILSSFYYGGYDDLFLMQSLAKPALSYYEKTKDYNALSLLYKMLAFENFEFYGHTSKGSAANRSVYFYEKVTALKDHYSELDKDARDNVFTAYNNLISPVGQTTDELKARMLSYYNDAIDFWNTDEVQTLDGQDDNFLSRILQIENDVLFAGDFIEEMPEDFQKQFQSLVSKIKVRWEKDGVKDEEGILFRAEIKGDLIHGANPDELIEKLIAHLDSIELPDYENDEEGALYHLSDFHNTSCAIFDIFRYSNIPPNKQGAYLERFYKKATDVQTHIPFGFWTGMMNEVCAEWFVEVAPFITEFKKKKDLLLKLVISRQPITYIHSLMVSEIASRIAKSVIENAPSIFTGFPGFSKEEDVQKYQAMLCDYVTNCALLHDCGKCEIVEVVNRQDRHLFEEEYSIIKMHPNKGYVMLSHDPNFAPFYDIIRGHHKSYDGKSGYPEDFDNTKSEYKPFIDLITIADSIDAATDILGRNYSKGKDFSSVFVELKSGAGTKYNPEIVAVIENDEALFNDLQQLTSEGRFEVYYRAYKEILG